MIISLEFFLKRFLNQKTKKNLWSAWDLINSFAPFFICLDCILLFRPFELLYFHYDKSFSHFDMSIKSFELAIYNKNNDCINKNNSKLKWNHWQMKMMQWASASWYKQMQWNIWNNRNAVGIHAYLWLQLNVERCFLQVLLIVHLQTSLIKHYMNAIIFFYHLSIHSV